MAFEASSGTLSKKLSNGRHSGLAGASVYDGVFASPPKNKLGASVAANHSSRAEDYREIFGGGGSRASSIPFLDVPELSEQKVSVDVRSSKLDYSKIFAGDGDLSFAAVRFEELYQQQPNTRKKSEKEWPPVERLSPSEASERSAFSDENNVRSPEASHLAFSGVKKFNMSYNKINNGNLTGTSGNNGTTHIAQLNAVRGYVHLVDEATPIYRTGSAKPVVSSVNDGGPKCNNFVRSSEDVLVGETVKRCAGVDVESQSSPNWFKLNSMGKPSDKYEVGSGNPHSKVPSSSTLPRNFNFGYGGDRTNDNGGSASNSPPYFEEEVDKNSVAATSAAALRKAIEEAQAKIKVAKEIMERKKAGVRNRGKSFSERLKPEERKDGNVSSGVSKSKKKKIRELCEEVEMPLHASSETRQEEVEMPLHASSETRQHTTGPAKVAANFEVRERVLSSENGETSRKETSSLVDHRRKVEEPEAEQFYDVENTGEISSPTIEVDVTQVSTTTSTHNVTGPVQLPEYSEVQKFVSGARETARGKVCNDIKSSQADHRRQEKSEPAQVAEQFFEFEDVTRMQAIDENIRKEKEKENIIAEEVFEKPQQGREGLKQAEKENNPKEVGKGIKIQNGTNRASDRSKDVGEARLEVEAFDQEKNKQKQRFSPKLKESGEIVLRFDESDKCERSPREFLEILNYGKLHDIGRLEDTTYMKRDLTTWGCVESEREVEEEYEKEQSHAHGLEDNEKLFINKAIKGERIKEKLNGFHLGKKIAQILSHVVEPEGIEKIHARDVSQKKENEIREEESGQRVDVGRTSTKVAVEELRNQGSNLGAADNGKSENQIPVIFADGDETLKVSEEAPSCKDSGSSITEPSKCLMEAYDSVEEKYDVEKADVLKTNGIHQDLELYNIKKPLEDETESSFVDENDLSDEIRMGMKSVRKRWDKPVSLFDIVHDLRQQVKELSPEFENVEYIKKSEVDADQVYDEDKTDCFGEQGRFASGITMQEAELSDISEEGGSVGICGETESSTSKEKDSENCEEIPISQNGEMNEESRPILSEDKNDRVAVHVEQSTASESLEKEKELERKQRRKIDEAKEREKEIEKGRIAVERAVREARERAFAEARERAAAEKAGASQRVKAEARERARKTSGEPNSKSVADKAREAKLKAERAAVERATAEARVRALEKAMSSKTASARKQNPQQHKGPSFTSTSRYPYSSNDGGSVSNSTERYDGANDESSQRCKARSERHQRISERAEKALAEKNRRDLLAQKEQAERNRLAETLDIEVKRWSSGKEGNLRALLSTLQYILGSESGWQPITLTEIITTTAVKKAYRKATLFVHPDKLQQRGANIQQKYTCEKVFDLLKEAWNKFNVEER